MACTVATFCAYNCLIEGLAMDRVPYPDAETVREVVESDAVRPLVLEPNEWDALAAAPPAVIPELAKLFSTPSIFGE